MVQFGSTTIFGTESYSQGHKGKWWLKTGLFQPGSDRDLSEGHSCIGTLPERTALQLEINVTAQLCRYRLFVRRAIFWICLVYRNGRLRPTLRWACWGSTRGACFLREQVYTGQAWWLGANGKQEQLRSITGINFRFQNWNHSLQLLRLAFSSTFRPFSVNTNKSPDSPGYKLELWRPLGSDHKQ